MSTMRYREALRQMLVGADDVDWIAGYCWFPQQRPKVSPWAPARPPVA